MTSFCDLDKSAVPFEALLLGVTLPKHAYDFIRKNKASGILTRFGRTEETGWYVIQDSLTGPELVWQQKNPPHCLLRERLNKFSLNEVLDFIDTTNTKKRISKEYSGVKVRMFGNRYACFKMHGTTCLECGIAGQYFWLERDKCNLQNNRSGKYHFNLYAVDPEGNEVLMTRDHMIPASHGGWDTLKNLRTLCERCNHKKADDFVYLVPT